MKPSRYWLSFDLGFRGNYEDLYLWLDHHEAKECGEGVATFLSSDSRESLIEELSLLFGSDKKARLYLIDRQNGGRFILGNRKPPQWAGAAPREVEADEEPL